MRDDGVKWYWKWNGWVVYEVGTYIKIRSKVYSQRSGYICIYIYVGIYKISAQRCYDPLHICCFGFSLCYIYTYSFPQKENLMYTKFYISKHQPNRKNIKQKQNSLSQPLNCYLVCVKWNVVRVDDLQYIVPQLIDNPIYLYRLHCVQFIENFIDNEFHWDKRKTRIYIHIYIYCIIKRDEGDQIDLWSIPIGINDYLQSQQLNKNVCAWKESCGYIFHL